MSYAPRFVPPNSLVEVTLRTVAGVMLLRPTPELVAQIWGILGRALELYPVRLHAVQFMSNHVHMLLSTDHGKQLAAFTKYLNRNISAVVKKMLHWKGPVWEPRPHYAIILDDAAAMARFQYVHSNGVKEGLVDHPSDSPWVSSAQALLGNGEVVAHWASTADRRRARRLGESTDARECGKEYRIVFTPLPGTEDLTADERRAMVAETFDEIARAAHIARDGRPTLGVEAIVTPQPLVPSELEKAPGPVVHGSSETEKEEFVAVRNEFIRAFRQAAKALAEGNRDAKFPPGSLPPNLPFVPWPPSVCIFWSLSRLRTTARASMGMRRRFTSAAGGAARAAAFRARQRSAR